MSYDIAICRPDIPADLTWRIADDWESRDDPDSPGVCLEPTYNHGPLMERLGVRPPDMDRLDAATVARRLSDALDRLDRLDPDLLEREHYTDRAGRRVTWGGGVPGCRTLLANMLAYCRTHPTYTFHCP